MELWKVSVLGYFQRNSIVANKDVINFSQQVPLFSKGRARNLLFKMANASISASQKIFYGWKLYRDQQSEDIQPGLLVFLATPTAIHNWSDMRSHVIRGCILLCIILFCS